MRRLLAVLLIALALATASVYAWAVMAPLTLSIGSAPVARVQTGTLTFTFKTTRIEATLPAPSTAGTTLLAIYSNQNIPGDQTTLTMPAGWTRLTTVNATNIGVNVLFETWAYFNNPGGISVVAAQVPIVNNIYFEVSEWSNVASASASALEASGTASAIAGTTLTPTTTGAVISTGDLALVAWDQFVAPPAAVTFTSPSGFTRLFDNGSDAAKNDHVDAEYMLNPKLGVLGPILTSTGTSSIAVGAVVVLRAAPPAVDQSSYLAY